MVAPSNAQTSTQGYKKYTKKSRKHYQKKSGNTFPVTHPKEMEIPKKLSKKKKLRFFFLRKLNNPQKNADSSMKSERQYTNKTRKFNREIAL